MILTLYLLRKNAASGHIILLRTKSMIGVTHLINLLFFYYFNFSFCVGILTINRYIVKQYLFSPVDPDFLNLIKNVIYTILVQIFHLRLVLTYLKDQQTFHH